MKTVEWRDGDNYIVAEELENGAGVIVFVSGFKGRFTAQIGWDLLRAIVQVGAAMMGGGEIRITEAGKEEQ